MWGTGSPNEVSNFSTIPGMMPNPSTVKKGNNKVKRSRESDGNPISASTKLQSEKTPSHLYKQKGFNFLYLHQILYFLQTKAEDQGKFPEMDGPVKCIPLLLLPF